MSLLRRMDKKIKKRCGKQEVKRKEGEGVEKKEVA